MSFFLSKDSNDIVYRNVRDLDGYFLKARNFTEWLWIKCKKHELLDSNHQQESIKHFHSRFWEKYLGATLLNRGLNPKKPLGEGRTDFVVTKDNVTIHIEAVVSGKGDPAKGDVVPEPPEPEKPGDCVTYDLPERQIQLRLTNSIKTKYENWLGTHSKKPHVSDNDPFVIALNGNQLGHLGSLPMIVKVLFSVGPLTYHFGRTVQPYYQSKPSINKLNGKEIILGHFLDDAHSQISGILYSHVDCVNRPKRLGGEFIFIHNPHSENKIPLSVFSFCKQYVYKKINETSFWFDIIEPGTLAISSNVATS